MPAVDCAALGFFYDLNGRGGARQRADSRPRDGLRQPRSIHTIPTTSRVPRTMHTSKLSPGRRMDTNTGGTQSRRDAAAPRHPTRPKSTGPAPPRHGTTTLPWRPCTELHSRASTRPIADNRHSEHTVRRHTQALANDGRTDTHKHAAKGPGPRQHAGHAGHQPRAAQTKNPRPPARCRQICPPRSSRLFGWHEEVGDSSRGWRPG